MVGVMEKMLSSEELRKIFGVSKTTIEAWLKTDSDFPRPFKISRRLFWKASEVEAYLETRRKLV